jgi:hypothetical protein
VCFWNALGLAVGLGIICGQRKRQQSCKKDRAYDWDDHIVPPEKPGGNAMPGILLLREQIVKGVAQNFRGAGAAKSRTPRGFQQSLLFTGRKQM